MESIEKFSQEKKKFTGQTVEAGIITELRRGAWTSLLTSQVTDRDTCAPMASSSSMSGRVSAVFDASDRAQDVATVLDGVLGQLAVGSCKFDAAAFKKISDTLEKAKKGAEVISKVTSSGAGLGPTGLKYTHRRLSNEKAAADRDWESGDSKRKERRALSSLDNFLNQNSNEPAIGKKIKGTTVCLGGRDRGKTGSSFKTKVAPLMKIKSQYPLPANGVQYTPDEATDILCKAKKPLPIIKE